MKILFAASPEIAIPSLELLSKKHDIVAVLTNPPSKKGRSGKLQATAIAEKAIELGIPVLSPEKLNAEVRETISQLKPELLVVFAYGKIFGPKFLALFPRGGINSHPSILPRWRGCAPIPYAILNGDHETGVSVQYLAKEMDCGDIIACEKIPLLGNETTTSLSETASFVGAKLLLQTVDRIQDGSAFALPQTNEGVSYCTSLSKDDGKIDWNSDAVTIYARLRAFTPWPGSFTTYKGINLSIHEMDCYPLLSSHETYGKEAQPGTVVEVDKSKGIMVQTRSGMVSLKVLQLQGKKALAFKDFLNGARDFVGSKLE